MGQFLVYANRNAVSCRAFPFFVDIQSNLLRDLPTTVVIPLCNPGSFADKPITRLCPVLEFNGQKYLALSQQLAGIERKRLGEVVADVSAYSEVLLAAWAWPVRVFAVRLARRLHLGGLWLRRVLVPVRSARG